MSVVALQKKADEKFSSEIAENICENWKCTLKERYTQEEYHLFFSNSTTHS